MSKRTPRHIEAVPASRPEPQRARAELGTMDEFDSEDERRFFSEPPASEDEQPLLSLEPVVSEAGYGELDFDAPQPPSAEERAWLLRAEARRATLQRWVGLTLAAGAAAVLVASADRYLSSKSGGVQTAATATPAPSVRALPVKLLAPSAAPSVLRVDEPSTKKINNAASSTSTEPSAPSAPGTVTVTAAGAAAPVVTSLAATTPTTPAAVATIASAPSKPSDAVVSHDDAARASGSVAAAASATDEGDAAELREKARLLLAGGRARDGVALARAAIERDPLDARSYVLLGAGLQDLGDWPAAHNVFRECTQKATHGGSATCQYFARR